MPQEQSDLDLHVLPRHVCPKTWYLYVLLMFLQCCQFHPNGNYVATGSSDRMIRLYDILNGSCVRVLTGHKVSLKTIMD